MMSFNAVGTDLHSLQNFMPCCCIEENLM